MGLVRLGRAGARRAGGEDPIAEAGRKALDRRLDRPGHAPLAAVRDMAVRPGGVLARRRARLVPEARLGEDDERPVRAGRALRLRDLPRGAAQVDRPGQRAPPLAPPDPAVRRPVALERAPPV